MSSTFLILINHRSLSHLTYNIMCFKTLFYSNKSSLFLASSRWNINGDDWSRSIAIEWSHRTALRRRRRKTFYHQNVRQEKKNLFLTSCRHQVLCCDEPEWTHRIITPLFLETFCCLSARMHEFSLAMFRKPPEKIRKQWSFCMKEEEKRKTWILDAAGKNSRHAHWARRMFADNDSVMQAKLWPKHLTFISLLPHYEFNLSYETVIFNTTLLPLGRYTWQNYWAADCGLQFDGE